MTDKELARRIEWYAHEFYNELESTVRPQGQTDVYFGNVEGRKIVLQYDEYGELEAAQEIGKPRVHCG